MSFEFHVRRELRMATVGRIEMLLLGNGFGEAGSESRSAGRKKIAHRFSGGKECVYGSRVPRARQKMGVPSPGDSDS